MFLLSFIISCHILLPGVLGEMWCYQCSSGQSGCGENMDIRTQHWIKCDNSRVRENYCVKVVEKIEAQVYVTRACMDQLLTNAQHRLDMPMVRRHGYCVYGINFERVLLEKGKLAVGDEYKKYCFCNDWNGCNAATLLTPFGGKIGVLGLGLVTWSILHVWHL